jgi:urate oxidase
MTALGSNRYGKSAIRLVRVIRDGDRHTVRDLTVAIALEGDFEAAHVDGDNSAVVATDTMKNTVYAFAREHLTGSVEQFALVLARHFAEFEQVSRAIVSADEHRWVRLPTEDGPAPDAFLRSGDYLRTAEVAVAADGESVVSGVRDLIVMKTTGSAFRGFPRDAYTTLADTDDRLMASRITAAWRYAGGGPADFDATFDAVGATMLDAFAMHQSPSPKPVGAGVDLDRRSRDARPASRARLGPHGAAEPPPLARGPLALRPGEPRRGLRRDDGAARADRGDGHAQLRPVLSGGRRTRPRRPGCAIRPACGRGGSCACRRPACPS